MCKLDVPVKCTAQNAALTLHWWTTDNISNDCSRQISEPRTLEAYVVTNIAVPASLYTYGIGYMN